MVGNAHDLSGSDESSTGSARMGEAVRLWVLKQRVANELREKLGKRQAAIVARDPHARRKPRPCGITIHPGHGCPLKCNYCYIYDIGFSSEPRPYPLNGEELIYALARNPYVVPERTLAAFGSVTEPLLPVLKERTLEYATSISKWLKLPIQLSTKLLIDEDFVENLRLADPGANILVSVSGLRYWKKLEPNAPDPLLRIERASIAARLGLRVDLFLRPIIPGLLSQDEMEGLFIAAREAGFSGVITGSLRVTRNIVDRLMAAGVPMDALRESLKRIKLSRDQISVPDKSTKEVARSIAAEVGLEYLPSACAANIRSHGTGCALCRFGPCGIPTRPEPSDIEEFLEILGLKGSASFSRDIIRVVLRRWDKRKALTAKVFLSEVYKRRAILQPV